MRLVGLAVLLAMTAGCAKQVVVYMKNTSAPGGPDYVIVEQKGEKDIVYDCVSNPEGERDPTCVKIRYRKQSIAAERKADRRDERMSDE